MSVNFKPIGDIKMKDYKALYEKQKEYLDYLLMYLNRIYPEKTKTQIRLESELSALETEEHELIVPSEEDVDRRFPVNVSMIRSCNLSTRNKWIYQGVKWAIEQIKKLNKPINQ
jgi:hypothetical protein